MRRERSMFGAPAVLALWMVLRLAGPAAIVGQNLGIAGEQRLKEQSAEEQGVDEQRPSEQRLDEQSTGREGGPPRLDVPGLVELVAENNSEIQSARLERQSAGIAYRKALGDADPELDLALDPYGLDSRRVEQFSETSRGFVPQGSDVDTHSLGLGLSYEQLLPTAGSLRAGIENTTEFRITEPAADAGEGTGDGSDDGSDDDQELVISQKPSLSIGLSQPVFVNGRFIDGRVFDAGRRVPELRRGQADIAVESRTNDQIQTALEQYVQVRSLRGQAAVTRARMEVAREQVSQAEVRRSAGQGSDQEVLSAQVQANRQEEQLLETRYALAQAEHRLGQLLGIDTSVSEMELSGELSLPELQRNVTVEELYRQAREQNNTLRRLQLSEAQITQESILDGRQGSPSISASLVLEPRYPDNREDSDRFGASFSEYFDEDAGLNWNVSVAVEIPLTQGSERSLRGAENRVELEKQRLQQSDYARRLRDNIEILVRRDRILSRRIELLETDVRFQTRRVENQQSRVELDTASPLSVEQLRLELRVKEQSLGDARAERFLNRVALRALTGENLEEQIRAAYGE